MVLKAFVKELFYLCVQKLRLPNNRAVILMYHAITERPDYFVSVPIAEFERQMAYLAKKGFQVISLEELVQRIKAGSPLRGSVVITFDDGYEDNLLVAFPTLQKFNFPATIFVTTDLMGKEDKRGLKRLSQSQWQQLEQSKLINIEPHTKSHPKLSKISIEEARAEIMGSKQLLEDALGKVCRYFAAPYGDFNDAVIELLQDIGFEAAVTVHEYSVTQYSSDLLKLPRVSIDRSTTFNQFKKKLSITNNWYKAILAKWHRMVSIVKQKIPL